MSFFANENASANSISVFLRAEDTFPPVKGKCMIYKTSDSSLIGTTEEKTLSTGATPDWVVFNYYSDPQPQLVKDTEYTIVCWANYNYAVYYNDYSFSKGKYNSTVYGTPPPNPMFINENRLYSIYCSYTPN